MVRQSDYSQPEVQACLSVLMEVMAVLGEFREDIVIVGGSVPPLLIPSAKDKHPRTLDIDLAVDYKKISDDTYKTIVEALKSRGYYQKEGEQPHVFRRDIKRSEIENEITVRIDFLAGEYGGTGKGHRHQKVQDAQARKARGCDLVFDHYVRIRLKGTLPNGAVNEVTVKIPSYDGKADAVYILLSNEPYAYGKDLDEERRVDYDADPSLHEQVVQRRCLL